MRIANLGGRATLVVPGSEDRGADIAKASGGQFRPEMQALYEEWDALRAFVAEGPSADASFLGFDTAGPDTWTTTVARLEDAGYPVGHATPEQADVRRVDQLAYVEAPWGVRVEVTHGLADAEEPFASPLVAGGFVTKGVGFGKPRHHSLALARAPFDLPKRLHHLMVEVTDRDDVGHAFDRAWNARCVIANGLGHHPNDGMFSFYVETPAGFQVEVGHGARLVTEDWDENHRYDRISTWGHQPLQPPII